MRYLTSFEPFRISKVLGLGNKVDVDESDALGYLIEDEQTRIVGMYLEDIRDGRRFLELARKGVAQKPVLLLKGGRTPTGSHATASHTARVKGYPAFSLPTIISPARVAVRTVDCGSQPGTDYSTRGPCSSMNPQIPGRRSSLSGLRWTSGTWPFGIAVPHSFRPLLRQCWICVTPACRCRCCRHIARLDLNSPH